MSEEASKPWPCPRCSEKLPAQTDLCWRCGSDRSGLMVDGFIPEVDLKRHEFCPICSYDVRYLKESASCPECGYELGEGWFDTAESAKKPALLVTHYRRNAFQQFLGSIGLGFFLVVAVVFACALLSDNSDMIRAAIAIAALLIFLPVFAKSIVELVLAFGADKDEAE